MEKRRVPLRKCLGCGEMKDKRSLVRVVKNKEGEISLDLYGKKPGRGAYLCKDAECLRKAQKARRLEKAFSSGIAPEIFEQMEKEIENAE